MEASGMDRIWRNRQNRQGNITLDKAFFNTNRIYELVTFNIDTILKFINVNIIYCGNPKPHLCFLSRRTLFTFVSCTLRNLIVWHFCSDFGQYLTIRVQYLSIFVNNIMTSPQSSKVVAKSSENVASRRRVVARLWQTNYTWMTTKASMIGHANASISSSRAVWRISKFFMTWGGEQSGEIKAALSRGTRGLSALEMAINNARQTWFGEY